MSRSSYIMRWVAVLPGAFLSAFLVQFPIHWFVMLLQYFGTEHDNSSTTYTNPLAAIPPEVLEYFGYAFFVPFVVTWVGARIAPKFKFQTSIALAIVLGIVSGVAATFVVDDISSGLYTVGRWIRLIVTVLLCISGIVAGLFKAYQVAEASKDKVVA